MHFDDETVPARKVLTVELNGARSFVLSGSVLKRACHVNWFYRSSDTNISAIVVAASCSLVPRDKSGLVTIILINIHLSNNCQY
jgi:hypothetical protein